MSTAAVIVAVVGALLIGLSAGWVGRSQRETRLTGKLIVTIGSEIAATVPVADLPNMREVCRFGGTMIAQEAVGTILPSLTVTVQSDQILRRDYTTEYRQRRRRYPIGRAT